MQRLGISFSDDPWLARFESRGNRCSIYLQRFAAGRLPRDSVVDELPQMARRNDARGYCEADCAARGTIGLKPILEGNLIVKTFVSCQIYCLEHLSPREGDPAKKMLLPHQGTELISQEILLAGGFPELQTSLGACRLYNQRMEAVSIPPEPDTVWYVGACSRCPRKIAALRRAILILPWPGRAVLERCYRARLLIRSQLQWPTE